MTWKDDIEAVGKAYTERTAAVNQRRALWAPAVTDVLMPTLDEARALMKAGGFRGPQVKHHVFGKFAEAVQLTTGQTATGQFFENGRTQAEQIGLEIDSTLGYSLRTDGRIVMWYRPHWLTRYENHPPMREQKVIDDGSALTVDMVRRHVVEFLRFALESSYLSWRCDKGPVGFLAGDLEP